MSYRAPHRKRERVQAGEPGSGYWIAYHKAKNGGPEERDKYWDWQRLESADWEDHLMVWRPRSSNLSEEEMMTTVIVDPERKHYSKLASRFANVTPGQVMVAGRAIGKSGATSAAVIQNAMASLSAAMQNAIGPLTSAVKKMTLDSVSGKHWGAPKHYDKGILRDCFSLAKCLGAPSTDASKNLYGYSPDHLEARCAKCGVGGITRWVSAPERRPDGRFRIEDGLGGVVQTLRARWQKMTCEEVRDKLTVLVVMTS